MVNWDAVGAIAESLGALGVIATLVYLGAQIRQNTATVRAASRHDIADGYRTINRLLLDPRVARAFSNGLSCYPDLPFEERSLFNTLMGEQSTFFQGVYALHESGNLSDDYYVSYRDWTASLLATPGGRAFHDAVKDQWPVGVTSELDDRLALGDLWDPRDHDGFRLDEARATKHL
jgi:hypothetical protein